MEKYDYKNLLKIAKKKLPGGISKKDRFEIPKITSFIMGNRTQVKNLVEVANTIRRDPEHLLKFLSKELATQGNIEGKTAIFQGKFNGVMINNKFNKYIEEFVLCSECKKPDTKLIKENRLVFMVCEACGAKKTTQKIR